MKYRLPALSLATILFSTLAHADAQQPASSVLSMPGAKPAAAAPAKPGSPAQKATTPPVNEQAKGFAMPTDQPDMKALLTGRRFLLDINANATPDPRGIHTGTAYILAEYRGAQQLNNSDTIIIRQLQDVSPITDYTPLIALDSKHSGMLSDSAVLTSRLALLSYDAHGYLVAQPLKTAGVATIHYDVQHNKVIGFNTVQRVVLGGQLVDLVPGKK